MARIFSINIFCFGAVQYAMVLQRNTPFFTEYVVSLDDEDIVQQLLSDKIVTTASGELIFANIAEKEYTELMQEILKAVIHHLQPTTT